MKIAIDIREAVGNKTGKGWYTAAMVSHLIGLGGDHRYVLYTHRINPEWEGMPGVRQKVFPQAGFRWHAAVRRDLKREKVDVFWAPTSYLIPAFAPRGVRVVVTVHDVVAFLFPEGHHKKALWLERLTLHRAVKRADKVLTVSRSTKHDLLKLFEVNESKIPIAPCAAASHFRVIEDAAELDAVRRRFNLPEKFILAVGTLSPRKNFDRLIRAYAKVLLKHDDIDLVIVGTSGWNFDNILEFNQSKRVHFPGYVTEHELAALYNLAEVFVFPSLYEGFGMPPLEAMACGCPVITSNTSSLPEVVGNAAMLVDPYSIDEIATAMDVVLSNRYMAHDLRKKGLERVEKFHWEVSAEQVMQALKGE